MKENNDFFEAFQEANALLDESVDHTLAGDDEAAQASYDKSKEVFLAGWRKFAGDNWLPESDG